MPYPPIGTGGGGLGALVVATRTDNGNPAVFANIAARDTYTATVDGTADAARINVTNADFAEEVFAIGTLSGSDVTDITAAFIRVNGAWVPVATNLVGTPGQDGQDGTANVPGLTVGQVIVGGSTAGTLAAGSARETSNMFEFDKSLMLPGGTLSIEGFEISNPGGQLVLTDTASNIEYSVASRAFSEAVGSGNHTIDNLASAADVAFQSREDETLTDTEIGVNFTQTVSSLVLQWTSSSAVTGSGNFYIVVHRGTSASDPVHYRSHTPAEVAAGSVFTLNSNTVHDTRAHPVIFRANQPYFARFISVGGAFTVGGTTVTQADIDGGGIFTTVGQQVPYYMVRFMTLTQDRIALFDDVPTTEAIQDTVAAMFTGGTHNGISFAYDDTDGFIDATVTGGVPQPGPSISAFSIDVPATINTGTNLNQGQTVSFTTAQTSQISAMTLVVTTGTDQTLTVPTNDGAHSQAVILAGIDTSSAGTVTFQIRATTTGGQIIMSNSQTVTIRAISADEQAYYGTRATNDFDTVATSELTSVDVQPAGSTYTISGSWPATHFIGILEPTDRPITSIIETAFNQETLSTWTRTAAARTINGQSYDLLTQQNNGPTGTFEFRVTHG